MVKKVLMTMFLLMMSMNIMNLMNMKMIINWNNMFMNSQIMFSIYVDKFSLVFTTIIFIVVINVFNFMTMYMKKNENMKMFMFMTIMFVMSMVLLVYSLNLWMMIFGWEGLGMTSFYLIFFYNKFDSWNSAIKTFINNKMGDSMLIMSVIYFTLFMNMNTFMYIFLMSLMTKSAQYPFMAWLPMAMAAPTPISAMVHSSTLVTAGLFVFFRFFFLIKEKSISNLFLNLCLLSMMISGMKAMLEKDMKKIIALSTLSQISLIMYLMLNNLKIMAFIYMCNHALFKSMLFINMGMMMMSNFSNQYKNFMSMNNMNFLFNMSYKISCMNLMNMTFFSSFFIKEKIISTKMENNLSNMKFIFLLINSFFTLNYSFKMMKFFNFKSHNNMNIIFFKKDMNLILFISMMLSLVFSKNYMNILLFNFNNNLILMLIYLIMLLFNMKIFMVKYKFIQLMMYLDVLLFIFPFKKMNKNFDLMEMWMEMISLNYYFKFKNSVMDKSIYMNINLLLIFMLFMFSI